MVLHEIPPDSPIPWDITQERPGYHIAGGRRRSSDVEPDGLRRRSSSPAAGRPEYLRYDQDLLRITRHFFEANKPVAWVCHGIEILTAAGVIQGRDGHDGRQVRARRRAGRRRATWTEPVVVDGNLVTRPDLARQRAVHARVHEDAAALRKRQNAPSILSL